MMHSRSVAELLTSTQRNQPPLSSGKDRMGHVLRDTTEAAPGQAASGVDAEPPLALVARVPLGAQKHENVRPDHADAAVRKPTARRSGAESPTGGSARVSLRRQTASAATRRPPSVAESVACGVRRIPAPGPAQVRVGYLGGEPLPARPRDCPPPPEPRGASCDRLSGLEIASVCAEPTPEICFFLYCY